MALDSERFVQTAFRNLTVISFSPFLASCRHLSVFSMELLQMLLLACCKFLSRSVASRL